MKKKKFISQSGFSIVEILIVLSVIAILTTIAIMQLGRSKTDLQRQRIAREFKVYLERARFDSVKRRAVNNADMARLILDSPTSFSAVLDFNENGTLDEATEKRLVDFSLRSNTQIVISDTFTYPVTLRFNQRGHIIATDNAGDSVNPVFTICSNNCSTTNPDTTVLSVSTTGTVAVLKTAPGSSPLPTPSPISTATPVFNCYVLVRSSSNQCVNN